MKKAALFTLGLVSIFFLNACKKDKEEFGNIVVNLTDAPAGYLQVNVDIQSIEVHVVPNAGNAQWITLPTQSGIYDLLTLQNGIDSTIVTTNQLPAGKITQMRLILGSNNSVMDNNNAVFPLTVPSGSQSGIKLSGPITVNANTTVQVLLDFDASKSVVQTGNQDFQLKPVIQVL
jgi:hypothetical protein